MFQERYNRIVLPFFFLTDLILPSISEIISINESLTSDSDPDLPGTIELVESQTLNRTFSTMHIVWQWPAPQFTNLFSSSL